MCKTRFLITHTFYTSDLCSTYTVCITYTVFSLAVAIILPIVCVLVIAFFIFMSFIAHKRYPHIGEKGVKRHRTKRQIIHVCSNNACTHQLCTLFKRRYCSLYTLSIDNMVYGALSMPSRPTMVHVRVWKNKILHAIAMLLHTHLVTRVQNTLEVNTTALITFSLSDIRVQHIHVFQPPVIVCYAECVLYRTTSV